MSVLRVLVDGEPLPTPEAIAFWKRFSEWMDEHPGDLAGFARGEGLASVHPEMHDGAPVLVASRTAPQGPYRVAPKKKTRETDPSWKDVQPAPRKNQPAPRKKR